MSKPPLTLLHGTYTIHRFAAATPLPADLLDAPFCWISRTDEELSIVCDAALVLDSATRSDGWSCLKVVGPIDFAVTGLLADIAAALAAVEVSIFALSTFDTDYILVNRAQLDAAIAALDKAGYSL